MAVIQRVLWLIMRFLDISCPAKDHYSKLTMRQLHHFKHSDYPRQGEAKWGLQKACCAALRKCRRLDADAQTRFPADLGMKVACIQLLHIKCLDFLHIKQVTGADTRGGRAVTRASTHLSNEQGGQQAHN